MKKTAVCILLIMLLSALDLHAKYENLKGFKVKRFPFFIYNDASYKLNHYYVGKMMGDFRFLKIDSSFRKEPKSGNTCIRIEYPILQENNKGWAQLSISQNPVNYWNSLRGGYDLTFAKKLFFYAKGTNGDEIVEFKMVKIDGADTDNTKLTTGALRLTKKWKLYEIDLSDSQLDEIAGGFSIFMANKLNPNGCVIYLDQIYYSDQAKPTNLSSKNSSDQFKY
ncbi:MAG: hypothetical protein KKH98_11370 [Spirochaetes bacterium]|nr:hypothetical protein [Spirochaetota bacterium]